MPLFCSESPIVSILAQSKRQRFTKPYRTDSTVSPTSLTSSPTTLPVDHFTPATPAPPSSYNMGQINSHLSTYSSCSFCGCYFQLISSLPFSMSVQMPPPHGGLPSPLKLVLQQCKCMNHTCARTPCRSPLTLFHFFLCTISLIIF